MEIGLHITWCSARSCIRAYYLEGLHSILFADGTSICSFDVNAEVATSKMGKEIENILIIISS
jgi:hypothetical protein